MSIEVDVRARQGDFTLSARFATQAPVTAVFGPSGAGKSTLLKLIAGLVPGEGSVRVSGLEVLSLPPDERRVGLVFQGARLFPHLSVDANLRYGWRLLPPGARRLVPERVIEALELGPLLGRRPRGLSGGEQKRVALGRALLASPRALLLDEPLAGLDAPARARLIPILERVGGILEAPVLLVSHSVTEVMRLAGDVVVLDGGRVLGQGPFFEVIGRTGVFELAESLGLTNLLPGEVTANEPDAMISRVRVGESLLTLPMGPHPIGAKVVLQLRLEDVLLSRNRPEGLSARNAIKGTLTRLEPVRDRVLVTLDIGVPLRAELTRGAIRELGLTPGVSAWAVFKATALRWG